MEAMARKFGYWASAALLINVGMAGVAPAWADEKMVTLNLGGKFCEFYPEDITAALQKLPGIKSVDAKERQKFVVVKYDAGKVNPNQMVAAVNGVKEEGKWHCEAKVK